jgi:magnesium transporter
MYLPLPITVTQFLDFWALFFLDGTFEPPELSTATGIGITVAIAGNILISLALNLQKLAHRRVERARVSSRTQNNVTVPNGSSPNQNAIGNMRGRDANGGISGRIDDDRLEEAEFDDNGDVFRGRPSRALGAARHSRLETQNLLSSSRRDYGAGTSSGSIDRKQASKKTFLSKFIPRRLRSRLPGGWVIHEDLHTTGRPQASVLNGSSIRAKPKFSEDHNESDYLKSKLWYLIPLVPIQR